MLKKACAMSAAASAILSILPKMSATLLLLAEKLFCLFIPVAAFYSAYPAHLPTCLRTPPYLSSRCPLRTVLCMANV